MRKVSCWVLLSFIVCPVWADNCVLTTDMLSQGGGASYDDYLYADTSQRELRNEGKQGKAFLCGQIDGKTYCSVGTKKRMQYAAVGGENSVPDAVYECINTGSSDRTSFRWVAHDVQANCTVKNRSEAKNVSGVDGGNDLYLVNGSYCKNIVENTTNVTIQEKQTNFWDTANTTLHTINNVTTSQINGGVQLVVSFSNNVTRRLNIMKDGVVEMWDGTGKTIASGVRSVVDGSVRAYNITADTYIKGLKITKDGVVELLGGAGSVIKRISDNTTKSYIATLDLFKTAISEVGETARTAMTETGQTVRSWGNDVRDVSVSAINGGVQLVAKFSDNTVQTFKIAGDTAVSILDNAGKNFNGALKIGANGVVEIYDSTTRTLLGGFKIATNGAVEIFNRSMTTIDKLSANTTDAYKATLKFFADNYNSFNDAVKTTIESAANSYNVTITALASMANTATKEAGETLRSWGNDVRDVSVSAINGGVQLVAKFSDNTVQTFKIAGDTTVSILDNAGKNFNGALKIGANGVVEIYDSTTRTLLGGFKIATNGAVEIFNRSMTTIDKLSANTTDAYKATLKFFADNYNSFNDAVKTTIESAANSYNVTINALASVAKTAIKEGGKTARAISNDTKNTLISFFDHVFGTTVDKDDLEALEAQIRNCTTVQEVDAIVNKKLQEAELNENQLRQVRSMLGELEEKTNARFEMVESWLGGLEQLAQDTANKLDRLGEQHRQLAALVRTKVNAKEVVNLIYTHTQKFTGGQEKQLYEILDEYTKELSAGQYAQVQDMIKNYVDPMINALNSRVSLVEQRSVAADKVASAMSILNAFASGADVSVWKNADGKFNGVRLASDATAGVVLGTAGGLISNSLIKKSQVEKGLEGVACTVGGQVVADYGDEFSVGMQ